MSLDPLTLIVNQLDRIERVQSRIEQKLDEKVDYRTFNEFKDRMEERAEHLEGTIDEINKAAVSPDQVTTMISSKLQESQARGITARDRWVRWAVAAASVLTFGLLLWDRIQSP